MDGAGGTKGLSWWLEGRRPAYSVGLKLPDNTPELAKILAGLEVWTPAVGGSAVG